MMMMCYNIHGMSPPVVLWIFLSLSLYKAEMAYAILF